MPSLLSPASFELGASALPPYMHAPSERRRPLLAARTALLSGQHTLRIVSTRWSRRAAFSPWCA